MLWIGVEVCVVAREAAGVGGRIGDNIGDAPLKTDELIPEVNNAGHGEGVAIDG